MFVLVKWAQTYAVMGGVSPVCPQSGCECGVFLLNVLQLQQFSSALLECVWGNWLQKCGRTFLAEGGQ